MSNRVEDQIWENIKKGDKVAYKAFVDKFYEPFFSFSFQYLKNREEAEELVQDLFVDIWLKRKTLEIKNIEAYCLTVIRNRSLNELAKRKGAKVTLSEKLKIDTQAYQDASELQKLIQEAIDQLPPKAKEVFLLCREEGLTYQAVADKMGIGKETVKSHMKTALQKLRVFLDAHGYQILLVSLFF